VHAPIAGLPGRLPLTLVAANRRVPRSGRRQRRSKVAPGFCLTAKTRHVSACENACKPRSAAPGRAQARLKRTQTQRSRSHSTQRAKAPPCSLSHLGATHRQEVTHQRRRLRAPHSHCRGGEQRRKKKKEKKEVFFFFCGGLTWRLFAIGCPNEWPPWGMNVILHFPA
jgi:hypothetical protein